VAEGEEVITMTLPVKLNRCRHPRDARRTLHKRRVKYTMSDCAICYSEVSAATGRTVMSCGHEYHMRCLFQWLQKPDGTGNCPCCRHEPTEHERLVAPPDSSVSDEEEEDEDDLPVYTPLMRAAYTGDVDMVESLLATGGVGINGEGERAEAVPLSVLLEERDVEGDTALVHAITSEQTQIVNMLISAGANIDTRNEDGDTPLIWAIRQCESDEIALDLIGRGASLTIAADAVGSSALEVAAEYNMITILQAILNRGVGRMGHALHAACASGASLCALALLEAGADPNYSLDGLTPLMQNVSKAPDSEIVNALIRRGANVNETDNTGWNALMWMTQADEPPDSDIMAALIDAMASWRRGPDGRWQQVMQSWGEGDAAPPPYSLAELTRSAARRIQAAWRRRPRLTEDDRAAASALCWLRLQLTVPIPFQRPEFKLKTS
jgi:ankyrin repeat protein